MNEDKVIESVFGIKENDIVARIYRNSGGARYLILSDTVAIPANKGKKRFENDPSPSNEFFGNILLTDIIFPGDISNNKLYQLFRLTERKDESED